MSQFLRDFLPTLSSVSDADREIPFHGSTDNAGDSVNFVSGIIRLSSFPALSVYPRVNGLCRKRGLPSQQSETTFNTGESEKIESILGLRCKQRNPNPMVNGLAGNQTKVVF